MSEYVVDTNVWAMIDRIEEVTTKTELECATNCLNWIKGFVEGSESLVVDDNHRILTEYYNNILPDGFAKRLLRRFNSSPFDRLILVNIKYDGELAVVPENLSNFKTGDRRFIAVALSREPIPPIIDATDTDWVKAKAALEANQIIVQELCSGYIEAKLK